MKKILIISLVFIAVNAYSQTPKYSNEFLNIGVGARALSMSKASCSITEDFSSSYWNPAGLALLNSNIEAGFMHSEYFAGIAKYDYAALAARIDATSTAGFSFIRFGVDDIPDTSELIDSQGNINYDKIKSFSAADYAFLFSYGRKSVIKGFSYGANIKIINRKAGNFANCWGLGVDVGAKYNYNNWQFGFSGKDVSGTYNAWTYDLTSQMKEVFSITGNIIPKNTLEITAPHFILGVGRKFDIYKKFTLLAASDLAFTTDGKRNVLIKNKAFSIAPCLGIELGYKDMVFLRGGIGNIQQEKDINKKNHTTIQTDFGVGVNLSNVISLDYSMTDIGDNSIALYSHIFSIKLKINKRVASNEK